MKGLSLDASHFNHKSKTWGLDTWVVFLPNEDQLLQALVIEKSTFSHQIAFALPQKSSDSK